MGSPPALSAHQLCHPVAVLKRALRRSFAKHLLAIPPATVSEECPNCPPPPLFPFLSPLVLTPFNMPARLVTNHLLAHPSFLQASSISIYLSTPSSEIQTDLLVRESLARGKKVFVPFCPQADETVMRMLRLNSVEAFERLGLNRWGIREVSEEEAGQLEDCEFGSARFRSGGADAFRTAEETGGLDMILVPGLLFDRLGERLGHGRGYYDRYITGTLDYPARFAKPPPTTGAQPLPLFCSRDTAR